MRPNHRQYVIWSLLAALVAVAGGCGGSAQKKGRHYEEQGGFSYDPPAGWKVSEFPGLKYKISTGTPNNGFAPNLNVVDENYSGDLKSYLEANKANLQKLFQDYVEVKEDTFQTASGMSAYRLVTENTQQGKGLRQTFFMFEKGSRKFVMTFSSLAEDGDKHDEEALSTAKTFATH